MLNNTAGADIRVSIIVITYNSDDFILETLNSIRAQDYGNIELVISDDCSTDNTLALVREWLSHPEHVDGFRKYELIANDPNKGVAGNCNTGLRVCSGEWIKLIAGDDVLLPGCISTFVAAMIEHPAEKLFFSRLRWFTNDIQHPTDIWPKVKMPTGLEAQLDAQLKGGFIKAPTVIMNKALLMEQGGFNEEYPFLEDDPLWVKFLLAGHRFCFVPQFLIGYRMHDNAISHAKGFINLRFFDSIKRFKQDVVLPIMRKRRMFFWYCITSWELQIQSAIVAQGNTREVIHFSQKVALKLILAVRLASKLFNSIIT
jgi:glycosyltransferase involved in cell wall biosynthesis